MNQHIKSLDDEMAKAWCEEADRRWKSDGADANNRVDAFVAIKAARGQMKRSKS